jgi:hypothetical protein
MTAPGIPAADFPYPAGSPVRAWEKAGVSRVYTSSVVGGLAFLARADHGYFPVPSDLEGMAPACRLPRLPLPGGRGDGQA